MKAFSFDQVNALIRKQLVMQCAWNEPVCRLQCEYAWIVMPHDNNHICKQRVSNNDRCTIYLSQVWTQYRDVNRKGTCIALFLQMHLVHWLMIILSIALPFEFRFGLSGSQFVCFSLRLFEMGLLNSTVYIKYTPCTSASLQTLTIRACVCAHSLYSLYLWVTKVWYVPFRFVAKKRVLCDNFDNSNVIKTTHSNTHPTFLFFDETQTERKNER